MRLAGIVLGLGLGGFVDGNHPASDHAVAQHGLGRAAADNDGRDGPEHDVDGLFHAATLVLTLVGVLMLWSDGVAGLSPRRLSVLVGQMIWAGASSTWLRA